jgi:thermostable 8-oxoguanine DNA glycosylase
MLDMDISKICYMILKARAFDVREGVVEEDYGSNPADEDFREVLEAHADDPVFEELKEMIEDLNIDEQCQVVALAWLGRGDFEKSEWAEALRLVRERHNEHTAEYLLGMPLLGDFLEEGFAAFDLHCNE